MNTTNRALNRLLIGLIGLILLAGGAALAAAALMPDALTSWTRGARAAAGQVDALLRDTSLSESTAFGAGQSWLLPAAAAAAVLVIVLLIVFIVRQGHGHEATLLTVRPRSAESASASAATDAAGSVIISSAVAVSSLTAALTDYSGVASVGVSAFRVKGATALKIVVSARRGVSPREIRDHVDMIVQRFDEVLGAEVPVLIKITGGFASRLSKGTRLAVPR